ncbi:hypothetical protein BD309DRAFT_984572, partial [Dichomitus squalens]
MFALQGELEHRHVKRFYSRTNKVAYEMQIARKERKRLLLASIHAKDSFKPLSALKQDHKRTKIASAEAHTRSIYSNSRTPPHAPVASLPARHYDVEKSQRDGFVIWSFLNQHEADDATKGFITLLREHLVRRMIGSDAEPADGFSDSHTHQENVTDLYRYLGYLAKYLKYPKYL